ncbi:LPS translocon maturation chaperone LptM [Shewanella surugensis]|uniref:Lipoprotein n=1 Tax=Shewanella surugensis TaxID=212020 RepID=A0ABT0LG44_9GAMM|nr:lipoprotein [Shewanella surugensis]MCL1126663.1 lipoprotein [Shewanella surugensis]
MLRKMKLFLLLALASLVILGCGQKSGLYREPEPEVTQAQPLDETPTQSQDTTTSSEVSNTVISDVSN